ncbi:MAG TPA: helix-turn-helix transcriptional regulator [Leptolyngbyaceae cyanobacterium]
MNTMVDEKNQKFNPNVPTLKQVRERLGMTQKQFGDELGVSDETISRHERGVQQMKFTFSQMKRLHRLLKDAGMSLEDLPDDID